MSISGPYDDEQNEQYYDARRPRPGLNMAPPEGGGRELDFSDMTSDDEPSTMALARSGRGAVGISSGAGSLGMAGAGPAEENSTGRSAATHSGFVGNDENPLADRTGRIHESPAMAGPNDSQLGIDQQKLKDLKSKGSPISRIHNPFVRALANIGDIAGTAFLPGYAAAPWTNVKYKSNVRQAEHAVAEDLGEQKSQAEIEEERAKAVQERANAEKALHPPANVKEEQLLYDKEGNAIGYRDENGKYYSSDDLKKSTDPQLQSVSRILSSARPKEPPVKEGETPLGERVPQLNKMLESRFQLLNPGKPLPAQYQLPQNATQKDYDRIDKGLEAEERARGTKAQQDEANSIRQQMLELSRQGLDLRKAEQDRKKTADLEKKTAPLQQSIDDADTAHQLAALAESGNAEADVDLALSFFKTMRSGGQGIRFTRQEQDLIMGARSAGQDLKAQAQKVIGQGQKFTPDQRKKIVQVIDLHAAAAQKALARIQAGGEAESNTIHYREGKVDYDIPPEKEADFLKKHPKAEKQ